MENKFTHAGVSRHNGKIKVRYCNDAARIKVLAKNGHNDLDIIELPHAMTKLEITEYLLSIDFDNGNAEVRKAIAAAHNKRAPKADRLTEIRNRKTTTTEPVAA